MLQIFNTLTRQKEVFVPLTPKQVLMYVCGPTVYNYIHIGNARSIVAFDTIRRYLAYSGYEVKLISNFTDIGDKLEQSAKTEQTTVANIAAKYIAMYKQDIENLNVLPAALNPRASENIEGIIEFIKQLLADHKAYIRNGSVYFRARSFDHYGYLVHQPLSELEVGASQRIADAETAEKEDPIDFALWKNEPDAQRQRWTSPWGEGIPGWHIECSVMAMRYLASEIDIHGGGEDLIFPHHENEIAQSESLSGHKFVRYWLHNAFVTVGRDNEKMSKSLGNFVTAHKLLEQYDSQLVRFFLSSTHYRRPLNFTYDALQASQRELDRLRAAWRNLQATKSTAISGPATLTTSLSEAEKAFKQAMDDDFNVQNALTVLFDLIKLSNKYVATDHPVQTDLIALEQKLEAWSAIFGLTLVSDPDQSEEELDEISASKLAARQKARDQHDFQTSDRLRDELLAAGIIVEDTPQGMRWHRQ